MTEEESNGISFKGSLSDFKDKISNLGRVENGWVLSYGDKVEEAFNLNKEEGTLSFYLIGDRTDASGEAIQRFEGDSNSIPDEIIKSIAQDEDDDESVDLSPETIAYYKKIGVPMSHIKGSANKKNEKVDDEIIESTIWDEWLQEEVENGDSIDSEYFFYDVHIFKSGKESDQDNFYSLKKSSRDEIIGWEANINRYGSLKITLSIPKNLKDDEIIDFSSLKILEIEPYSDDEESWGTEHYYSISPKAMENIKARVLEAKG